MKRYPQYKDSGVNWLGDIPEHWEVKKLKYIAQIVLGKMLQGNSSGNDYLKPYLRSANIQWNKPDVSDIKQMWLTKNEMNSYLVKSKDILVSEGGEVGRACIWNNEIEECYIQNSVHKITCTQKYSAFYIYYQFYIIGQKGYFESIVNRVSIGHLTREKLINIKFIIPPLSEQKKIACFLDSKLEEIDKFISNKQRLIELLKEQKTAIINRAVTKGLNPHAPMKPSGIEWLGDIPAHWETLPLKHIAKIQTGVTLGKSYITASLETRPYLRVANVQDGYLDLSDIKNIDLPKNEVNRYILKAGDVLMTEGGDVDKLGRGYV
ncbi:restriction endonuclease subunit S, partial [Nodularia sp. UHCC 0506]|uniref:restriction endonuclease subunit S n=1 Tax=Nodularia sp. UHCC 0506 TaxID=3110243 RepID=UPI002B2182DF